MTVYTLTDNGVLRKDRIGEQRVILLIIVRITNFKIHK